MTKTKTGITPDEIRRLGDLAKISMTPQEERRLREELSSILEYFRTVEKVSNDTVIFAAMEQAENLRPDEVGISDPEGAMKGVPQKKGRLVKAPRVF